MKKMLVCLVLMASGSVTGCDYFERSETTRAEIQGLVKGFSEATQKDATTMLAMYEVGAETTSVGNGQIQRGIEAIRKSTDENVGSQGKITIALGSIDVTLLGPGYALSVTPFALTDTTGPAFYPPKKGVSTLVWKKTPQGWRVVHEHESYQ